MTKITEQQLIEQARGLRAYLSNSDLVREAEDPIPVRLNGVEISTDPTKLTPEMIAQLKAAPYVSPQLKASYDAAMKSPAPTSAPNDSTDPLAANNAIATGSKPAATPAATSTPPAADPRAQYDQFKADDAKKSAGEDVKKMASTPLNSIPRFGVAIDPKTGYIYYGDAGGESNQPQPKKYPFKWMQPGGPAESIRDAERIRAAGLEIVSYSDKGLFGDVGPYAMVDPKKLEIILNPPAPVVPPAPEDPKKPDIVEPLPPTTDVKKPPVVRPVAPSDDVKKIQILLKNQNFDIGPEGVTGILNQPTQLAIIQRLKSATPQNSQRNLDANGRPSTLQAFDTNKKTVYEMTDLTNLIRLMEADPAPAKSAPPTDALTKQIQQLILSKDAKALPKYHDDGHWGEETAKSVYAMIGGRSDTNIAASGQPAYKAAKDASLDPTNLTPQAYNAVNGTQQGRINPAGQRANAKLAIADPNAKRTGYKMTPDEAANVLAGNPSANDVIAMGFKDANGNADMDALRKLAATAVKKESVGYGEDSILARIVDLARR